MMQNPLFLNLLLVMISVGVEAAPRSLLGQVFKDHSARQWHLVNMNSSVLKHFDTVTIAWEEGDTFLGDEALAMAKMINEEPQVAMMTAEGAGGGGSNGCVDGLENNPGGPPRIPTEHELFMLIVRSHEEIFRFFEHHHGYHPRAAILVLIVCDYNSPDRLINPDIFRHQLELVWKEFRILNILVVDDCSISDSLLAYDPFRPVGNGSGRGRIYKINAQNVKEIDPYLMRDMHGYPVTVAAYKFFIPKGKNNSAVEYINQRDKKFVQLFANVTKATIVTKSSSDRHFAGKMTGNRSATGTLGMLLQKKADFDYYARPLDYYGRCLIEFAYPPIEYDHMVVIAHMPPTIPFLRAWVLYFTPGVYALFFGTFCIIFLMCYFSRLVWKRKMDGLFHEILRYYLSIPEQRIFKLTADSERLAVAFPLLGTIVMFTMVQAVYFKVVSHPPHERMIETLKELSESTITKICVFILHVSQRLFEDMDDAVSKTLLSMLKPAGTVEYMRSILDPSVALVVRNSDWKMLLRAIEGASASFYSIPETVQTNVLSYIVPYGSPFLPVLSRISHSVIESGISSKWYDEHKVVHHQYMKDNVLKIFKYRNFNVGFDQVKSCFLILGMGVMGSCVIFLLEILFFKWYHWKLKKCLKKHASNLEIQYSMYHTKNQRVYFMK